MLPGYLLTYELSGLGDGRWWEVVGLEVEGGRKVCVPGPAWAWLGRQVKSGRLSGRIQIQIQVRLGRYGSW